MSEMVQPWKFVDEPVNVHQQLDLLERKDGTPASTLSGFKVVKAEDLPSENILLFTRRYSIISRIKMPLGIWHEDIAPHVIRTHVGRHVNPYSGH